MQKNGLEHFCESFKFLLYLSTNKKLLFSKILIALANLPDGYDLASITLIDHSEMKTLHDI